MSGSAIAIPDGRRAKALRVLLNFTQRDVAKLAGIGRSSVIRFEAGQAVRPVVAEAIARVLGVAVESRSIAATDTEEPT